MTSEEHCIYVSTKGIMKCCDIYDKKIDDIIIEINNSTKQSIQTVYLHVDYIKEFSYKINLLNKPIILISGSGDYTIPHDLFTDSEFNDFLNNEKIYHYFAQNCYIENNKITKIPIGLDYHTLSWNNSYWGCQQTPLIQEEGLINIKNTSKHFYERKMLCYSTFHFVNYNNKFGYSRTDIKNIIPQSLVYYEPNKIDRLTTWQNQSEFTFVISPFGNGLDCHRTWEALILGCIAIVETSPIDILYHDLPVLIIKNWHEVTQELLEKTVIEYKNKTFNYEKLTLNYWKLLIDFCNIAT